MSKKMSVRQSVIAGNWYPGDAKELRQQLTGFLSTTKMGEPASEVFALFVPHAGYIYSGRTAAHAFAQVAGSSYERVIIASPFHALSNAELLTTPFEQYETPLGRVDVDHEGIEQLNAMLADQQMPLIEETLRDQEHSLEIELPFLQHVLDGPFELIPVMVRTHHVETLKTLGQAFAELMKTKKTLLVASTDLSHFYTAAIAKTLDERVLQYIEALSPLELLAGNEQGIAQACGAGAVAATLWAAQAEGAEQVKILHYSHSGMVTGDFQSVVGYGSGVIYKGKNDR